MDGKNILLIHGEKSSRSKALHPAFEERLKLALKLTQRNKYDLILISGGRTRKQFPPESQIGYKYLTDKVRVPLIQEDQSRTTVENILFSQKMLSHYRISNIDVITSKTRLCRFRYLYEKLWPQLQGRHTIFGAKDSYFFLYPLAEMAYLFYSFFDLRERGITRLTKKIFRNAT
jgi:uncharacterized SAM-binding protein YcdF (DUF218 family)